jgi:hypothetical protein
MNWEELYTGFAVAMAFYALDTAWDHAPSWARAVTCRRAKMILEDYYGPAQQ